MTIDQMIEATIGKEGGYSNNSHDTGGETMWGITAKVARANGYTGSMRDLPRARAVAIYRQEYAIKPGFAAVAEIMPSVGEELFDTGVNMGQALPALWLQEWLNVFNRQGKLYADIKEDGQIGPATLASLRGLRMSRGAEAETVLLRALNCSQGERYKVLSQKRPANEEFTWGWLRNRVA